MELHLKYSHLLEKCRKVLYGEKYLQKKKKIIKCKKKVSFFKKTISFSDIFCLKPNGIRNLIKLGLQARRMLLKNLIFFIKNRIEDYSNSRNIPSVLGTSKLSPFIKHGQIHVETIWEKCIKVKKKGHNINF